MNKKTFKETPATTNTDLSNYSSLHQTSFDPPSPSNIIISNHQYHPNNYLPNGKTPATTTITIKPQKVARDSLIHKNDIFQFDDVDSVHTGDIYFKETPQSSFESSDLTYKSNSISKSSNPRKTKTKKLSNAKQSLANFITPIFRGVMNNQTGANGQMTKKSNSATPLRHPQSTSSLVSSPSMSSKKEKNNSTKNGKNNGLTPVIAEAAEPADKPVALNGVNNSNGSLERSHTFTKKLNSFRSLIHPKNKTSSHASIAAVLPASAEETLQPNGDVTKEENSISIQSEKKLHTISNNLYVNSSPNKQLTITSSLNTNNSNSNQERKDFDVSKVSNSIVDLISIPAMSASTASFTVKSHQNKTNEHNFDKSNHLEVNVDKENHFLNANGDSSGNNDLNRTHSLLSKSKSKLFDKFKLNSDTNSSKNLTVKKK